jgi:hypothetical protein
MNRICIYQKDIQRITGKSERQSRNIIVKIKTILNKQKHQPVSLQEFCSYMDIDIKEAIKFIK